MSVQNEKCHAAKMQNVWTLLDFLNASAKKDIQEMDKNAKVCLKFL